MLITVTVREETASSASHSALFPELLATNIVCLKALTINGTRHQANTGCMLAELGLTLVGSKASKGQGDELPSNGSRSMQKSSKRMLY